MKKKLVPKGKHSVFSNVIFVLKDAMVHYPLIFVLVILIALFSTLSTLLSSYLPSLVVAGVEKNWHFSKIIISILIVVVAIACMLIFNFYLNSLFTVYKSMCRLNYSMYVNKRIMVMPYSRLENPSTQVKIDQITNLIFADNDSIGINIIFNSILEFIFTISGITATIAILSKLNIWISIFVFAISLINTFINRLSKAYYQGNRDKWAASDKKISYINHKLTQTEYAMDIRVYACERWILNKLEQAIDERGLWVKKVQGHNNLLNIIRTFVNFIYDIVVIGYIVYSIVKGHISVSEFVLFTGFVAQLSVFINRFFNSVNNAVVGSNDVQLIRNFLDDSTPSGKSSNLLKLVDSQPIRIRFENVSFRYPGASENIINNLNVEIERGEKIALIGENGAGKSTLIKLLCGIYKPTEGNIYVNDISLNDYSTESIATLYSVVFQQFVVLPFSIAQNVSMSEIENTDVEKVKDCMTTVGLESLTEDLDAMLIKEASENGLNLSGGQIQRLLIARAAYKDSSCYLLDEPTSALDPVIESEIYQKYNEITKGKTVVFVSHRLASTRFCDRILYLKNGQIVEQGSHEDLLELNGEYTKMYQTQAQYYK